MRLYGTNGDQTDRGGAQDYRSHLTDGSPQECGSDADVRRRGRDPGCCSLCTRPGQCHAGKYTQCLDQVGRVDTLFPQFVLERFFRSKEQQSGLELCLPGHFGNLGIRQIVQAAQGQNIPVMHSEPGHRLPDGLPQLPPGQRLGRAGISTGALIVSLDSLLVTLVPAHIATIVVLHTTEGRFTYPCPEILRLLDLQTRQMRQQSHQSLLAEILGEVLIHRQAIQIGRCHGGRVCTETGQRLRLPALSPSDNGNIHRVLIHKHNL